MSRTFKITGGDAVLGPNGGPTTVSGHDKARQDIALALLSPVQPNGFGFGLPEIMNRESGGEIGIEFALRQAITDGFNRLRSLQQSSLGNRTPDELFVDISNLMVQRQRSDIRVYRWALDVRTISGVLKQLKGNLS